MSDHLGAAICEVVSAHRQGTVELSPEHREEIARKAFEAGFYARPKGDSFCRHELHGTPREFHFTPGGPAMDMCPEAWAAYKAAIDDVLREVGRG